jgi:hypothetical protein
MEDLIKDSSFEVYHNSEGAIPNNWDRTLLTYPSEKSSFQVFLGFEGKPKKTKDTVKNKSKEKKPIDVEKLAGAITSTATAVGSVATTVDAFTPQRKKDLKQVCGSKPLLSKKERAIYDKCVADYNAGKTSGVNEKSAPPIEEPIKPNNNKKIIIGVVVAGVLLTAFIGFKKGWFGNKPA